MGAFLLALSVVLVFVGSRISRGHALAATTAVGYGYGILRANYPDGISHFMFDAAVATLYLTEFLRRDKTKIDSSLVQWTVALILWALLMIPLGLVIGRQPLLIQLVGLRSTVFFLPMLLIGARLVESDLIVWARAVVWLNLVAFGFAAAEYRLGVTLFYPANAVTDIIYKSSDVAGDFLRIPAVFANAHAYGGTMMMTLPFVVWRGLTSRGIERWISWGVVLLTAAGPFLCGARQPVVQMALVLVVLVGMGRLHRRLLIPLLAVGVLIGSYVGEDERLQRILTLADVDSVSARIELSANERFWDIVLEYPLGAGLASAAGTSVPFFLSGMAQPAIGMENEYGRLALELGVPGLLLWLVFLGWSLWLRRPPSSSSFAIQGGWAVALVMWASAFIGTGMLTAIPGTVLLLAMMGLSVQASQAASPALQPASTSSARPASMGTMKALR